jgi:hypothetical protein
MNVTTAKYRTDKVMNGYLPAYERLATEVCRSLGALRVPRILEIGAGDGAGMEMFRSLFCTDEVYGVDIEPSRASIPNVTVLDQRDRGLSGRLPGPWDLIVDDASHQGGHTATTLATTWHTVRPGGYYVIEDWNFYDAKGNASNLWQMLFGSMLDYSYVGNRYDTTYSGALSDVESVTVQHGLIIIHKGAAEGGS